MALHTERYTVIPSPSQVLRYAVQRRNTAYCYICHYARKQPGRIICRVHLPFLYMLLSAHPAATASGPIGLPFLDPI